MVLGQSRENRLSGDAWILLESPQLADEARRVLHKKTIGRRYIELFQSTPKEVTMARKGRMPPGRIYHPPHNHYDRPAPYGPPGAPHWELSGRHHHYGGTGTAYQPFTHGRPPRSNTNIPADRVVSCDY